MDTAQKRVTVYFDPQLHKALRVKAAETDRSLSDLANEAVRPSLAEDAGDLEAMDGGRQINRLKFNLKFIGGNLELSRAT